MTRARLHTALRGSFYDILDVPRLIEVLALAQPIGYDPGEALNAHMSFIALPFARTAQWIACHEIDGWSTAGDFADCVVFLRLNPSGFTAGSRPLRAKDKGDCVIKMPKSRSS